MKKKLLSVSLATAIALCSAASVGAIDVGEPVEVNTAPSYGTVIWTETYNSIDELIDNADVCTIASVQSQSVEKIHDLYFTHSYVETEDGCTYDIIQTGAYINGVPTNMINDVALLEEGETYFLCLKEINYHGSIYYVILGGNQGYGVFEPSANVVEAVNYDERAVFSTMQIEETAEGISAYNIEASTYAVRSDNAGFDPQFYFWEDTSLTFNVDSALDYDYDLGNRIVVGATSWNGTSDFYLRETSSSNADIQVVASDYPETWAGCTWPDADYYTYADGYEIYTLNSVEITMNGFVNTNTYPSEYAFWVGVSCHEFGHALWSLT